MFFNFSYAFFLISLIDKKSGHKKTKNFVHGTNKVKKF